jgi:hypothetical protein
VLVLALLLRLTTRRVLLNLYVVVLLLLHYRRLFRGCSYCSCCCYWHLLLMRSNTSSTSRSGGRTGISRSTNMFIQHAANFLRPSSSPTCCGASHDLFCRLARLVPYLRPGSPGEQ